MNLNRQAKFAPYWWGGAILLLLLLETLIVYSQVHKLGIKPSALRFFYVPIMLTLPMSAIAPLYLAVKNEPKTLISESERKRLYTISMAYLGLLICLGEFL